MGGGNEKRKKKGGGGVLSGGFFVLQVGKGHKRKKECEAVKGRVEGFV